MALGKETIEHIESVMSKYIESIRPKAEIRDQLDIAYRIEGQSVIIYEKRRHMDGEPYENPIAKATYVGTRKVWKIFWKRADLKWHGYDPKLEVKAIEKFIEQVEKDEYSCFWG